MNFLLRVKKTNQTIAPSSRVDIRDNSHVTPLACAATNGHIDVLGCLIGHGANIRQADKRGYFPFHRAAQNGHLEAMKMLLPNKYMCSEEEYLYFWSRAMTCSVESGKVEALAFVMNMRPEKGIREVSPLLLAASYGHVSLMEWYLGQAGTSISERDHEGASALHYAARYGQVNAVQFLLDRDPEQIHVKKNGSDDWLPGGGTPLHEAAEGGHSEVIKCLLRHGPEVDAPSIYGRTSLFLAAYRGHTQALELLLGAGASLTATDSNGWQPLHVAIRCGHKTCVEALLRKKLILRRKHRTILPR